VSNDTKKPSSSLPPDLTRRGFLTSAAFGGMVAAAAPILAEAQTATGNAGANQGNSAAPAAPAQPSQFDRGATYSSCGGDYMTDVLRSLGIEYFAATPGNTFMGLHESIVNYGMITEPKLRSILTLHEEISVAMCHGYAKIEGKPMACGMHTTVGLQHAAMAIYNAYADRVPIYMITACSLDATRRSSYVEWNHAASGTTRPVHCSTSANRPYGLTKSP